MKLFISDTDTGYAENKSTYKFLFRGYIIEKWNLPNSPDNFNLALNSIEYSAADAMHLELNAALDKLENKKLSHNKFVATRKLKRDIHFSLLYNSYWQLVIKKHVLRLVLEKLIQLVPEKISEIELDLNEEFSLAEIDFHTFFEGINLKYHFRENKTSLLQQVKPILKNWAYYAYHTAKKLSGYGLTKHPNKKNILLLIYDVPSLHIVMERFYELVNESKNVHLTIVALSSGIAKNKAIDVQYLSGKNITVLDYTLFRKGNSQNHHDLYNLLESWHPAYKLIRKQKLIENLEDHYAWVGTAIEKLKPDVCFTLGVLEISRVISDVARYYKVPSVNVDYGLFTDDPLFMQSNIKFDIRACISEMNAGIWKNRKDPSTAHHLIGFCKLDSYRHVTIDREVLFHKLNFNSASKTIFFASSWAAANKSYNLEKQRIVSELAQLCHKNNWNLLIKKHPAETDSLINELIHTLNFKQQVVLEHSELKLEEAISLSNFVTTQSSSMVADTLYFEKPFCFLSSTANGNITDFYTTFKSDKLIETFSNSRDFEVFVQQLSSPNEFKNWLQNVNQVKEKYLYQTDGKASERLLHLLKSISVSKA